MMALTATATKSTRTFVCHRLGMVKPSQVIQAPNRPNIKYIVHPNPDTFEEMFLSLVEEVKQHRKTAPRTIIYCHTYDTCSMIYLFFRSMLGPYMTDPCGAMDLARFRMVDMFTACTTPTVKESIINNFSNPNSKLRIVVATIAFGMGMDCPNVRQVIHWGPSGDIEQYMQETGRTGRDGLPATAVLYYLPLKGVQVDDSMTNYCRNTSTCRRQILLEHFNDNVLETEHTETKCLCCDVCALHCDCVVCHKM